MNYLHCGCGQQIDTTDKRPGEVVVCPGCRREMPIPGESAEDFARQLATSDTPGIFAHVQLNTGGEGGASNPAPQPKPAGWFRRILQRLGLG